MVEDFRDQNQGSSLTFSRREWGKSNKSFRIFDAVGEFRNGYQTFIINIIFIIIIIIINIFFIIIIFFFFGPSVLS